MQQRNRWIVLGLAGALVLALPVAGLADHRFGDVDDASPHATGIDFVADFGITRGCNAEGTQFCPADELTRDQMATFLFRTSGYDPQTGPVVNGLNTELVRGRLTWAGHEDYVLAGGAPTECQTTNVGEPIPLAEVVLSHQITAVPAGVPSEVNVALDVDREATDGEYDVCFTRLDGENLEPGSYETSVSQDVYVFASGDDGDFTPADAGSRGVDLDTAQRAAAAREAR